MSLPNSPEVNTAKNLYGTDALGRTMPEASEVIPFRQNRYVGIFYFLWLNIDRVYDVSAILKEHPEAVSSCASPPWGPHHSFHFWGQPMFGYYRSDDPWVLRRHACLLADAGVDFLIFDTTNAVIYDKVFMKLCEVFDEQRKLGVRAPQIAFMVNTQAGATAQAIYDTLYKPNLYPELWFRWKGRPLMICDPAEASDELKRFFTLRKAHWPFELVDTHNEWHWEATYPQVVSYDDDPSRPEQLNVSVGQNLHQQDGRVEMMSTGHARGRSFHQGQMDGRPDSFKYGFNFQEQWERAFQVDPEVVFITGWNEWVAIQLSDKGPAVFCDQFNLEFSRDVEMMKAGYGDNYYMQMAANIRRFKGMYPDPCAREAKTIEISGSFSQWENVSFEYRDHLLDTMPRDFPGCGDNHYKIQTGRNDFKTLKVAHDEKTIYFYCQTREDISPHADPNWMWLFIDVKGNGRPGWEGFNYRVNGSPSGLEETSVEVSTGGWNWEPAGISKYRIENNEMHIAIPKSRLAIESEEFVIEFKWVDNAQEPGSILDAYINGDSAPGGRFRYRYSAAG